MILILMILVNWFGVRVRVSFGQTTPKTQAPVSSVVPQSTFIPTASSVAIPAQRVQSGVDPAADAKRVDYRSAVNVFPAVDKSKSPRTDINTILSGADAQRLNQEFIPKEDSQSSFGLKFNLETFTEQKAWSKDISIDPKWKDLYDKITTSVYHPCCGVTISTNDCGHAIALTGLTKKMLQAGRSEGEILTEIMQWEKFYFPRHYVMMALAMRKAGQDVSKIDLSPDYSSYQSERYATDFLVY